LSGGELAALLGDLPLTAYSDYQPAISAALLAAAAAAPSDGAEFSRQMVRVCGQPVTALWCSSGTTGAPKALPECELVVQEQEKVGGRCCRCWIYVSLLLTSIGQQYCAARFACLWHYVQTHARQRCVSSTSLLP
jgi:hypothetical protein